MMLLYNRRALGLISLCFLGVGLIIIGRLCYLQLYAAPYFQQRGLQQRYVSLTVPAFRGLIFDCCGVCIACNDQQYSAFLTPSDLKRSTETMAYLKHDYPRVAEQFSNNRDKYFMWLDRHLSTTCYQKLVARGNPDIHFVDEAARYYPLSSFRPVLGSTDIDLQGIAGVERKFHNKLHGNPMSVMLEKDARKGYWVTDEYDDIAVEHGKNIQLTVDAGLQCLVAQELEKTVNSYKAESGSALIMDPDSGHILSLADYYNNDVIGSSTAAALERGNNVITQCYEFGSVFKVFAALAALDEKVVDCEEVIDCEGKIAFLRGFRLENWKTQHKLTFAEVVQESSNVGIAKVVDRLGGRLYDHYVRLGFGKKTGIEFPAERDGFVNHPQNWSKSSPYVMSFGYEVMASLLQLATAFSIIGNGGYAVQPTLLAGTELAQGERKRLYGQEVVDLIKKILERLGARYQVPGMVVMGKTGTARCLENGEYSTERHIYTFVGMIENGPYRRVIATFVKRPEAKKLWASQVSAPLFQRIAQKIVLYDLTHDRYKGAVKAFSI